ncbi:MAG: hypothetical protein EA357_04350 [Micavibrio sp.]|nr:MAG: hypothetical protein EA357_04350 [Micavibrio sp.]
MNARCGQKVALWNDAQHVYTCQFYARRRKNNLYEIRFEFSAHEAMMEVVISDSGYVPIRKDVALDEAIRMIKDYDKQAEQHYRAAHRDLSKPRLEKNIARKRKKRTHVQSIQTRLK